MLYEHVFDYHGDDKVDIAWALVRPDLFTKFCSFFDDAISVNKEAAVHHMDESGYSQVQEVKGLSFTLAKRILATPTAKPQIEPVTEAPIAHPQDDALENPPPSVIFVPRALWEGKTPKSVRDNMRQQDMDFPDHVIAHVVYNWCGLTPEEFARKHTELSSLGLH